MGEQFFAGLACGERQHHRRRFGLRNDQIDSVKAEEHDQGRQSDAFIAVHEGVVAGEARGVCRGEGGKITFPVVKFVLGPRQRGLQPDLNSKRGNSQAVGYTVRACMIWLGLAARVWRILQPCFLAVETTDLRRAKF